MNRSSDLVVDKGISEAIGGLRLEAISSSRKPVICERGFFTLSRSNEPELRVRVQRVHFHFLGPQRLFGIFAIVICSYLYYSFITNAPHPFYASTRLLTTRDLDYSSSPDHVPIDPLRL